MKIIHYSFLFLYICTLHGYTSNELIIKTAALMDILYELIDTKTAWPHFKEQRTYIEQTCTSASCTKMHECIDQCRTILNMYAHNIKNPTDLNAIQETLSLLEHAIHDRKLLRHPCAFPFF